MSNSEKATTKQWFAVIAGLLGAFMAVLDTSITNASLQDIQGGLSASLDEGAWISTAYLVAEITVIPLTGFFMQVFSLKRFFVWNTAFFIIASILCGTASSLPQIIFYRILQGATGGILIPICVTIIFTYLPKSQQATGMGLFALAATFAPSIGPSIGGWLTVNYSWTYIFYLNLVPGALLLAMALYGLKETPMNLGLLKQGDWGGIVALSMALGSFTVVLEEGVREDWWQSNFIILLSWIFAFSFASFLYIELTSAKPFINLRLLKRRNFLVATILASVFGYGLYGSIFMLPYFLASIRHLDAQQIGGIIMWQGLPQLLIIPFVPLLVRKFDNRKLLAIGFLLFGVSAVMNSDLTHDWAKDQFFWSQLVRSLGGPFIITPLTAIAYYGIEPSEIGSASGLNNMMRNLGGSIGIGSLGALFNHQYHLHFVRIAESVNRFSASAQQHLQERNATFGSGLGTGAKVMASVARDLNKEAQVMAFGDAFLVIGLLFFMGAALLVFTKKPQAAPAAEASH